MKIEERDNLKTGDIVWAMMVSDVMAEVDCYVKDFHLVELIFLSIERGSNGNIVVARKDNGKIENFVFHYVFINAVECLDNYIDSLKKQIKKIEAEIKLQTDVRNEKQKEKNKNKEK